MRVETGIEKGDRDAAAGKSRICIEPQRSRKNVRAVFLYGGVFLDLVFGLFEKARAPCTDRFKMCGCGSVRSDERAHLLVQASERHKFAVRVARANRADRLRRFYVRTCFRG